ncbi:NAD(P)-binding protein [Mollisia scopiformis]|uniref:NAD(P)-binding protein n=1 Tax=Mollisia scopiformis TaxID=149040 RepID=A0A194XWT4_MOLSC|nr:NAD(P)-binding protein [Mollisia scopiformis]KUJ24499.1 NAD(P)-binding protein [Mollisia scopiformis]
MSLLIKILATLGSLTLASQTLKLLTFLKFWLRPSTLSLYHYPLSSQPPWAFITGSSDGIGLGLALELAHSGFNILLHGRNPTKLSAAQSTILAECPNIQVKYIVADVCLPGDQMLQKIQEIKDQVKDLHVTILVNNVGGPAPGMVPLYKTMQQTQDWEIDGQIAMNIRFTCHLTSALIPLLPNPALILNIGSVSDVGLPYIAMYSGAKGFVDSWTRALSREMRAENRGIEVLCIRPMKVTGTSFRKEKGEWGMPDSRTFAKGTLGRVGGGRVVTEGYWVHSIRVGMIDLLPEWILMKHIVKTMKEEAEKDKKRE